MPLEASKHMLDDVWFATEIFDSVREGVVVLECEQWREFIDVKFFNTHIDIVLQHEVEERPNLGIELVIDMRASEARAIGACYRWERKGYIAEYIE